MTISPPKVRHFSPRRDVCRSLIAKYIHTPIPDQNLKKVSIGSVLVLYVPCSCEVPPLFGKNRLGEESGDLEVPARGRTRGRLNSRLEDQIRTTTYPRIRKFAGKCDLSEKSFFFLLV